MMSRRSGKNYNRFDNIPGWIEDFNNSKVEPVPSEFYYPIYNVDDNNSDVETISEETQESTRPSKKTTETKSTGSIKKTPETKSIKKQSIGDYQNIRHLDDGVVVLGTGLNISSDVLFLKPIHQVSHSYCYKGELKRKTENLRPLITKIANMNLTDSPDDSFALGMYLYHPIDDQTAAHIISKYYIDKYNSIVSENPGLDDWIICVVNLLIHGNFVNLVGKPLLRTDSELNFKQYKFMDRIPTEPIQQPYKSSTIKSLMKGVLGKTSKSSCEPKSYPVFLYELDLFVRVPKLLRIGEMYSYLAPSCIAPAFMDPILTYVPLTKENDKTTFSVQLNFSIPILGKMYADNITKEYRLMYHEPLLTSADAVTNKITYSKIINVDIRSNGGGMVINSPGCNVQNITNVSMYTIFTNALCIGCSCGEQRVHVINRNAFLFDNSDKTMLRISENVAKRRNDVDYLDRNINNNIRLFYAKLGYSDIVKYSKLRL